MLVFFTEFDFFLTQKAFIILHMEVYIEYAILDNFVMDYLIISLACVGRNKKNGVKKRIISALFGTVFAVYLPILKIAAPFNYICKILVGVLMVFFSGCFYNFINFLYRTALFFLVTFMFGGIIYGVASLTGIKYDYINNIYQSKIPLFVWLLLGGIIYLILYKTFGVFYRKKKIFPFLRKCELYADGQKLKTQGFIDSGNGIIFKDFYSVCVADSVLADRLNKCGLLQGRFVGKVDFQTASGKSVMKIYELDKIKVFYDEKENIIFKAKIGIVESKIKFADDYSLILPGEFA